MIPLEKMSDEEFERHALAILQRELGVDGLGRLLRVYRAGGGDYTRDRHRWLDGATIRDIMTEVERRSRPHNDVQDGHISAAASACPPEDYPGGPVVARGRPWKQMRPSEYIGKLTVAVQTRTGL